MGILFVTLLGILFLAVVPGYIFGRHTNLKRSKQFAEALEKAFQPQRRAYNWIGSLTGFHATYMLDDERALKATLILPPRHTPLYYLFSLFMFGRERLNLAVTLKRLKQTAELRRNDSKDLVRRNGPAPSYRQRESLAEDGQLTLCSQRQTERDALQQFAAQVAGRIDQVQQVLLDKEPDERLYAVFRLKNPQDVAPLAQAVVALLDAIETPQR